MAWINYTEKTIEKLEYFVKTNDFCYLRPVIKGDKTDSIEVFLEFTFDNSDKDHPVISQASLNYSFLYFLSIGQEVYPEDHKTENR